MGIKASSGPLSTLRIRTRGLGGQVESSKGTLLAKAGTRSADWQQTVGARQEATAVIWQVEKQGDGTLLHQLQ